jgi:dUTP pyrophosphatase
MKTVVGFKKLTEDAVIPNYAHSGDAGLDICSVEDVTVYPGKYIGVHTGLAVEIPDGFEIQVRPRSGMALRHGLTVLNTPGTIDQGFKNEIMVILINHSTTPYQIHKGDRIAQLVVNKYESVITTSVVELSDSERGLNGFGSSGK